MQNNYLQLRAVFLVIFCIILLNGSFVQANQYKISIRDTTKSTTKITTNTKNATKITDTRSDKPSYLKNGVKVNFIPFKPNADKFIVKTPQAPILPRDDDSNKILNNVKVYPNPVSDQLNLTYNVNKDSNVTIKIMDVLGNEITTLLSQHMSAGEQNNSFSISSRLNTGFYFIRLIVGTETVIKRISVL